MKSRCSVRKMSIRESRLYERNSIALMCCICLVVATDAFWLIVGLLNENIFPGKSSLLFVLLFIVIVLCIALGLWSEMKIRQKDFLRLRQASLFFDSLLAAEVTILCIAHNLCFPLSGVNVLFDIPLSSLYLFMLVFLPMVRFRDSVYVISLSVAAITIPCIATGRENYNPLPEFLMIICIITAYAAYRMLNIRYLSEEQRLEEHKEQYLKMTNESLETVAATIDAKNLYLKGHSKRVAEYSREVAGRMGMSEDDCQAVYFAGLLHDIGKIGIPNSILDKQQKLTDEEYDVIKRHCSLGSEILKSMSAVPELAQVARWHHERYDGSGYPDGLKGEEIPIFARIISVCDTYDAMSSERSYRKPLLREEIIGQLVKYRGIQFDPKVVDAMLTTLQAQ